MALGTSPFILNLNENRISEIENDSFESLTSLVYVNLESNELTHIDSNLFFNLSKLRNVNFLQNRFKENENIELNGIDKQLIILC